MAASRTRTSLAVELFLWGSVAFVAVLAVAWLRLPDLERGIGTLVDDVAAELGLQEPRP